MREAVFTKSNQSQHWIPDFRVTNQNAGFEFMLDLSKISGASIVMLLLIFSVHFTHNAPLNKEEYLIKCKPIGKFSTGKK